jgi:hypothetical protein
MQSMQSMPQALDDRRTQGKMRSKWILLPLPIYPIAQHRFSLPLIGNSPG